MQAARSAARHVASAERVQCTASQRERDVELTKSVVVLRVYGSCTRVDPDIVGLQKCPCWRSKLRHPQLSVISGAAKREEKWTVGLSSDVQR